MHQEDFDTVKEEYQKDNRLYFSDLRSFHADLAQGRGEGPVAQRAELLARIGYWGETISPGEGYTYSFFTHLEMEADKYEQEFKKHNYYNLPHFKQLWDDTKNGGITLPGQLE